MPEFLKETDLKDHKEYGMLWTLTMQHSTYFQQNKISVLNKVLLL